MFSSGLFVIENGNRPADVQAFLIIRSDREQTREIHLSFRPHDEQARGRMIVIALSVLGISSAVKPAFGNDGFLSPMRESRPMSILNEINSIKPNDQIVHPKHGVGLIVNIESKKFTDGSEQLYYQIDITTGTIWVPAGGSSTRIRKLTPKSELAKYRELLKSRPIPLSEDHRERQYNLTERWNESSFEARCEVLRDLNAHRRLKPLNEGNADLLRIARAEVCAEWAAADGLSLQDAAEHIESLLLEGKPPFGE